MATDAWEYLLEEKRTGMIGLRRIADEGREVLLDAPPEQHRRIDQLVELMDFMDEEMAALAERWHARKETR
jgi:hypothetical protein